MFYLRFPDSTNVPLTAANGRVILCSWKGKLERSDEYRNLSREELLGRYREKTQFSDATGLLREFHMADDFELRQVLGGIDEDTFVKAMRGADGSIVIRFLKNLQDSILRFVCEDIDVCEASEEEMTEAQRRMLEAGAFALVRDESFDSEYH